MGPSPAEPLGPVGPVAPRAPAGPDGPAFPSSPVQLLKSRPRRVNATGPPTNDVKLRLMNAPFSKLSPHGAQQVAALCSSLLFSATKKCAATQGRTRWFESHARAKSN